MRFFASWWERLPWREGAPTVPMALAVVGYLGNNLDAYIKDLAQSGFDTVHLRVRLNKKFAVPLFALIMAMISAPFAFLVGNRGAMAGIGASIGVAVAYLAIGQLFEKIGNVNYLPAAIAAWSPNAIFSLAGMYLLLKMRS